MHAPLAALAPFLVASLLAGPGAPAPAVLDVEGLRAGEAAVELAPAANVGERREAIVRRDASHGRVIDAFTARPVARATVELWSEEIDEHYGGYHRYGVATTGADGRYSVNRRDGDRTAEKLRVVAPGYLTFTEAAGEADGVVHLFPAEARAPRLRVVDLQGRPIDGARVTTTYTCAHDVPAFVHETGADGVVELTGYGLQDAIPELRVLAPGYAGIKYLAGEPILAAASRGETYTQRLRRTPGASGTLIDTDGTPIADTALHVLDGDGFHVVRTNAEGRFAIPARYDDGELLIRLLPDDGRGAAYGDAGGNGVFRRGGDDLPEGVPTGRVRLVLEGAPDGASTEGLEVRTSEGWSDTADEDGWIELPVPSDERGAAVFAQVANPSGTLLGLTADGPVHFLNNGPARESTLGGNNSVTIHLPLLVKVAAGEETEAVLPWSLGERAALLPAGVADSVVVEQGSRSVVHRANDDGTLDAWLWSDEPFTLWFPETDVVRSARAPLTGKALDALVAELTEARERDAADAPAGRTHLRVAEDAEVAVQTLVYGEVAVTRDGDGTLIEGPRGPALVRYEREGHATVWSRALLGVGGASAPRAPAHASLRVEGAAWIDGVAEADDLAALHPGPFHCVAQFLDGRRVGLQLDLQPGEDRVIRLAD